MTADLVDYLLVFDRPSLTFRVMTDLLETPLDSPKLVAVKTSIPNDPDVIHLFEQMHPDGYWLQKDYKGRVLGDGVQYGPYGTTHFVLSYLSELGMDRTDDRIERAANRYLDLQSKNGSWNRSFSCEYTYNLRTFIKLGYREDPRIQKTIDLMLNTHREDGGYLCDMHEGKYKTRSTKSCIRGCVKAIMAFAELPEYWNHLRCKELVNYFLQHEVIYCTKQPGTFINKSSGLLSFPINWDNSLWQPLYALSKMGYGGHPATQRAWQLLESKLDDIGRATLEYTPSQCPWKVGKCGEVNPWLTFYVLLAKKYRTERGLKNE